MKDRMPKDEHIALLKSAIGANVTARIEHDKRRRAEQQGKPPEPLKIFERRRPDGRRPRCRDRAPLAHFHGALMVQTTGFNFAPTLEIGVR